MRLNELEGATPQSLLIVEFKIQNSRVLYDLLSLNRKQSTSRVTCPLPPHAYIITCREIYLYIHKHFDNNRYLHYLEFIAFTIFSIWYLHIIINL